MSIISMVWASATNISIVQNLSGIFNFNFPDKFLIIHVQNQNKN